MSSNTRSSVKRKLSTPSISELDYLPNTTSSNNNTNITPSSKNLNRVRKMRNNSKSKNSNNSNNSNSNNSNNSNNSEQEEDTEQEEDDEYISKLVQSNLADPSKLIKLLQLQFKTNENKKKNKKKKKKKSKKKKKKRKKRTTKKVSLPFNPTLYFRNINICTKDIDESFIEDKKILSLSYYNKNYDGVINGCKIHALKKINKISERIKGEFVINWVDDRIKDNDGECKAKYYIGKSGDFYGFTYLHKLLLLDKNYRICSLCNKNLKKVSYSNHMNTIHSKAIEESEYTCPHNGCDKAFIIKGDLQKHLKHTHNRKVELEQDCPKCLKSNKNNKLKKGIMYRDQYKNDGTITVNCLWKQYKMDKSITEWWVVRCNKCSFRRKWISDSHIYS